MENLKQLEADKFKEIYSNEKLRNAVAHAHGCLDSRGVFKHKKALMYPTSYKVTDEQIQEAKEETERAKIETLKKNKNILLFVGMGMGYEERYKDDVCNWRIRTEFKTPNGRVYFVEFGTGLDNTTIRCDHSIDRTREDELSSNVHNQQEFYNYKNLERNSELGKYTKSRILEIVNRTFNCNFKKVVIDEYNISCDGVICESPK